MVLLHDSGSRYVGKMYNDEWMRERGFLNEDVKLAKDLIRSHMDKKLVFVSSSDSLSHAVNLMKQYDISQIPVKENGSFVGSLSDHQIYKRILENPAIINSLIICGITSSYFSPVICS